MEKMLLLPSAQRLAMGLQGRAKMEAEFDEKIVIDRYLAAVAGIVTAGEARSKSSLRA